MCNRVKQHYKNLMPVDNAYKIYHIIYMYYEHTLLVFFDPQNYIKPTQLYMYDCNIK